VARSTPVDRLDAGRRRRRGRRRARRWWWWCVPSRSLLVVRACFAGV